MIFYSTTDPNYKVSFIDAFRMGLSPDKGLFIPSHIPVLPSSFWNDLVSKDATEIAFSLLSPYMIDEIDKNSCLSIIEKTYAFPFPVVALDETISCLELFHGPTLAFKDVGARFMSELHQHIYQNDVNTTVLVATSGDTGGAVAQSFVGVAGVDVVILFPKGKVSAIQELQLTTLGKNIKAIAVEGDFDLCQAMVKRAFLDTSLVNLQLSSANSINVARWMPQMVYYAFVYKMLAKRKKPLVVSVPSGNFGNIAAGLLASAMGLPIAKWMAATNINDTIPRFLNTGIWKEQKTLPTLSNAMDVSVPSNFVRIQKLQEFWGAKSVFSSQSCTDFDTLHAIRELYENYHYIADPHGAVGYHVLKHFLQENKDYQGVFVETAHPIKFPETVENALNIKLEYPENVKVLLSKTAVYDTISTYEELVEILRR